MSRSLRLNAHLTVPALDADEVAAIPSGTYVLARTRAGMWVRATLMCHWEEDWHQVYVTHEWIRGGWVTLDPPREHFAHSGEIVAYHSSPTATGIYGFLDDSRVRGQE